MRWGRVVAAGLVAAGFLMAADAPGPFEQVKRLGRGVNIIGYDPIWKNFEKGRFKEKHFKAIGDAGFDSVRINLHALGRMDDSYRLPDAWWTTLDWAVKNALANHLAVILDLHNFTDVAKDPAAFRPRIMAFWKQAAARYKDAPPEVMFEILNEPNGKLTPALWDEYFKEALGIIRESNPTRTVIIGPPFWNGIRHLRELELPAADRNIIVTVHYYEPMRFTHQGAPWTEWKSVKGATWGSEADRAKVDADFAGVAEWAKEHDRPILLGEFGAYDKAEMESRARYTGYVARTAEKLDWAWSYWQFDSDFVLYNIKRDQWVEPLLKALVP